MADDLATRCHSLSLDDEESTVVDLGGSNSGDNSAKVSLILVGKLLSGRPFNVDAFKRTMTHSWGLSQNIVMRIIGSNLFVIQFFHWRDKEKVLVGRPWCFDQKLLVLKEITCNEQPFDVSLTQSPFWIRIKHLPFNCHADGDVRAIVSSMGEILEI